MMPRVMTSPPATRTLTKRGAKPRAAGKADEYGARHVRATTTPHDSYDNSDDSAVKVEKPRATNKAERRAMAT